MVNAYRKLRNEETPIKSRLAVVHSLVYNLAASPGALELEKKAETLDVELEKRLTTDGRTPYTPITESERMAFDKQLDEIFETLTKLPVLPPQQVQKEYEEFSEEKIDAFGL